MLYKTLYSFCIVSHKAKKREGNSASDLFQPYDKSPDTNRKL